MSYGAMGTVDSLTGKTSFVVDIYVVSDKELMESIKK